jgi:beta-1,4-mannosyl-glycoprotein beta-1,4-N-acetylglucosaminyltransferase
VIWDVFPFFNELELLDIRLNVHSPYVDRFVLVESHRTHSNKPKPLFYNENKYLFEKFHDRIIHLIANFDESNPWIAEAIQRDTPVLAGIDFRDEDTILHSDLDEIVDWTRIGKVDGFYQIQMRMYHYYLNVWRGHWSLPQIFRGSDLHRLGNRFKECRYHHECDDGERAPTFRGAGWHFSYMGGPQRIKTKIEAFSDQKFNRADLTSVEAITERVNNFDDVLGRGPEEGFWLKKVEINEENHPKYLVDNQEKFRHLILT